jgi:hypothetical protein
MGFRREGIPASGMTMPITAMYKNYSAALGEHHIRPTWKIRSIQPIPVAKAM